MRVVNIVSLLLFVALANARPEPGNREDGRFDNNVQKLARSSSAVPDTPLNNGISNDARGLMMPDQQRAQTMIDRRAQMPMEMQSARSAQMRQQSNHNNQDPFSMASQNDQPINEKKQPLSMMPQFGGLVPSANQDNPLLMPRFPEMRRSFGNAQQFGFETPPVMPPMMTPVSGKNITDGHIPPGPSQAEMMMMMQQQQMAMMNELARRQGREGMGRFITPQVPNLEKLMLQRQQAMIAQQVMMARQAALTFGLSGKIDSNSKIQINDATGPASEAGHTSFPIPVAMTSSGNPPQGTDSMKTGQDITSVRPQSQTMPSEDQVPERESISTFVQRLRSSGMVQEPPTEVRMMPDHRMQQLPIIQDHLLPNPYSVQEALMQNSRNNEIGMMEGRPMIDNPRLRPVARLQGAAFPGPVAEDQQPVVDDSRMPQLAILQDIRMQQLKSIMQNRRMQQLSMMQDPRVKQLATMQDPRIHMLPQMQPTFPSVMGIQEQIEQGHMMQGQEMQDPRIQAPSLMQDPASSFSATIERQNPIMPPVSGHDLTSIKSKLASQIGPEPTNPPSMQQVMEFESQLHDAREQILRSFYTDLLKYRDLSQQIQAQLNAKLMILRQIETQLATPLRYVLATQTTTPQLSLPIGQ